MEQQITEKKSLYCEDDLYRIYVITIVSFLHLFNDACQIQMNSSMIGNDELRLKRKERPWLSAIINYSHRLSSVNHH